MDHPAVLQANDSHDAARRKDALGARSVGRQRRPSFLVAEVQDGIEVLRSKPDEIHARSQSARAYVRARRVLLVTPTMTM